MNPLPLLGLAAAATTVGIDYRAPDDCPKVVEFFEQLARRARGPLRMTPVAEAETSFSIEIVAAPWGAGPGKIGRVRRTGSSESSDPREVVGSDCRELVEALALTTALSLHQASSASNTAMEASVRARPPPPRAVPVPEWTYGIGLTASGVLLPGPLGGVEIFVERRPDSVPSGGVALGLPDIRLAAFHARNDVVGAPGSARIVAWGGSLDVCPAHVHSGRTAQTGVRLCGRAAAGALLGTGIEIENPLSGSAFFAATGLGLRLGSTIAQLVRIELGAGADLSLARTRFVFQVPPRVVVARVPPVVWNAGASLGVAIP